MAYELKTKLNDADVEKFLETIQDSQKKEDCFTLLQIFEQLSGHNGKMWGKNIVGFGTYTYKYASGQTGDWMRTGFAPRAGGISLYIMPGYQFGDMQEPLEKLGKHKTGKSCLNIKRLSDIDLKVLEEIITAGLDDMQRMYPE